MVSRFLRHDIDLDCKVFASLVDILYSTLNACVFAYIFLYINHVKVAATAPVALFEVLPHKQHRLQASRIPNTDGNGSHIVDAGGIEQPGMGLESYLPLHPLNKVGDNNSPGDQVNPFHSTRSLRPKRILRVLSQTYVVS